MSREDIVRVALGEVGVKEDLRNNEDKAGRIEEYIKSVTDSRFMVDIGREFVVGDAWCAAFASWVYKKSGHPLEHGHGFGFYGCGRMIEWLAKKDMFVDRKAYDPQPGDLIFFDWGMYQVEDGVELDDKTAQKIVDHVGIVLEASSRPDSEGDDMSGVITIEGNWGGFPNGGVKKLWRPYAKNNIIGYGNVLG